MVHRGAVWPVESESGIRNCGRCRFHVESAIRKFGRIRKNRYPPKSITGVEFGHFDHQNRVLRPQKPQTRCFRPDRIKRWSTADIADFRFGTRNLENYASQRKTVGAIRSGVPKYSLTRESEPLRRHWYPSPPKKPKIAIFGQNRRSFLRRSDSNIGPNPRHVYIFEIAMSVGIW